MGPIERVPEQFINILTTCTNHARLPITTQAKLDCYLLTMLVSELGTKDHPKLILPGTFLTTVYM